MPHLTAEENGVKFHVHPRTVERWGTVGYIHTFVDQHGVIRYDTNEIEVGFQKYGPKKMRDGRKKNGRTPIPIVVAEDGETK